MIPQKTVQEILETAKVEDIVQDYVNLKRRGANMIGLCPFHNEKTPSFTVSPAKNLFKCFGCGKGGDATRFIMEHENLSFPDALRQVAKKYRIEIEEKELTPAMMAEQAERESLFIVNEYAKSFYKDQLVNTDLGKSIGLSYFKGRGFREETIEKFGLGFAPNNRDTFTKKAAQMGYKPDYLQKLGLSKNGRDFFWNRVMFTIHNLTGKPIAFAGRILQKDAKAPKYINSPETEIYTKSKILYGAYFAKNQIRKLDECILVEGYTDVISLHQAGITNVVASSGTSLTDGQILLIKRFTPNIKILYDGDAAGIKAALRGLDLVLEKDMNVKVVLLPEGEDPDSHLQNVGATAFKEYLDQEAKDFILFKTDLLLSEVGADPVKRAGLVRDIVESIARVPDPFKRAFYVKECARIMELEEEVLVTETNKVVKKILEKREVDRQRKSRTKVNIVSDDGAWPTEVPPPGAMDEPSGPMPIPAKDKTAKDEFQEREIARLLIAFGGQVFNEAENITVAEYILASIEEVMDEFESKQYERIARECLERVLAKEDLSPKYFIAHTDHTLSSLAIDLLHSPYEYSLGWDERGYPLQSQKKPEDNFSEDSKSALLRFKLKKVMRLSERNQQQLKALSTADDTNKIMRLLKVQSKLNEMRNDIAKELGTVILR